MLYQRARPPELNRSVASMEAPQIYRKSLCLLVNRVISYAAPVVGSPSNVAN
jgi:hypothetical protein